MTRGHGDRVDHQAGVDILVGTILEEADFPAAGFFGGGAEEADGVVRVRGLVFEGLAGGDEGGDGARRDEVVAAGVPDVRESVVFGVEDNVAAPGAVGVGYFQGGFEAVGGALDVVGWVGALEGFEELADVVVGLVFCVG